jgi:hypothetical protein
MLRWFWWRINAWSEIGAMCAAGVSSLVLQSRLANPIVEIIRGFDHRLPAGPLDGSDPHGFAWLMILTTSFTTISWIVITILTPPEPIEKLKSFYEKVRPSDIGWKPIAASVPAHASQSLLWAAADWIAGCGMIYCALFGIGSLIFGHSLRAVLLLSLGAACAWFIYWDLNRRGWANFAEQEAPVAANEQPVLHR